MAARRRRSHRRLGSTVLGAVKVCKLKGKKLVCRSAKGMAGLGRKPRRRKMHGLGAACRTAKGKFKKC